MFPASDDLSVLNKYQFWRHHILGYKTYIKDALSVIDSALNSNFRERLEFKELLQNLDDDCSQYNKDMTELAGKVAFSTKVIWNTGNLFCGPAGYDNNPNLEEAYLKLLPKDRRDLIDKAAKKCTKLASKSDLIQQVMDDIKEGKTIDEANIEKLNDALGVARDFMKVWYQLLPEQLEYVFSNIAKFAPLTEKNKETKFTIIGLA